jgi:hypothetical protein
MGLTPEVLHLPLGSQAFGFRFEFFNYTTDFSWLSSLLTIHCEASGTLSSSELVSIINLLMCCVTCNI